MTAEIKKNARECTRGVSNTHALNTWGTHNDEETTQRKLALGLPLSDLRTVIDWLSVTFDKEKHSVHEILILLDKYLHFPDDFLNGFDDTLNYYDDDLKFLTEKSKFAFNTLLTSGYRQSISYGNISIMFDDYGNNNKGFLLSLSGQGCRDFEMLLKDDLTWIDFLKEIMEYSINITRIDLAVDDFSGYLPFDDVLNFASNQKIVSKLKEYETRGKYDLTSSEHKGRTLNFGSPRSRVNIRLYEKGLQMKEKFYWNRIELEIKNENAYNAVQQIIMQPNEETAISKITIGILSNYMKICNLKQTDSNRSRWTLWKNWEKFIKDVPKVKIGIEMPESTIRTKLEWVQKQPPKSIAQIMMYLTGSTEPTQEELNAQIGFLTNLYDLGKEKMTEKDFKLIEQSLNINKKAYPNK